jgi:retron-type reverse transcriptase
MDDYRRRLRFRDGYRIRQEFDERLRQRYGQQHHQPFQAARVLDGQPLLPRIVAQENLMVVHAHRARQGGSASGPDGIRDEMLSHREVAGIYRAVNREILDGQFEPSAARHVPLPKKSGGHRILAIRSIATRTVSAALAHALTPFWEAIFLDGSHGFRPARSTWTLLTHLERIWRRTSGSN